MCRFLQRLNRASIASDGVLVMDQKNGRRTITRFHRTIMVLHHLPPGYCQDPLRQGVSLAAGVKQQGAVGEVGIFVQENLQPFGIGNPGPARGLDFDGQEPVRSFWALRAAAWFCRFAGRREAPSQVRCGRPARWRQPRRGAKSRLKRWFPCERRR